MRIASIPINEELRLQDLYSYDILDSETEKEFDDLLEVAAQIYGCPIAAITFVDRERQFFKATKGIDNAVRETSRDEAFCAHTILENEVMVVKDATQDVRFNENTNVSGGLLIRFYAGAPIVSKSGYKLGSVCVMDNHPRELKPEEIRTLTIISQQVSKLLELRLKNNLLKRKAEEQLQLEKQLLYRLLQEQDNYSLQISTALHENIAQALAATKFYLELAEGECIAKDDLISKSRQSVELLVKQVRELSQSITPTTLKDFCLQELLQNMLSDFYNRTGVTARLIYEGIRKLPSESAIAIYRIVEDQLKNIHQHANASAVTISLHVCQTVYLSIRDNGVGVELKSFQKGVGMQKILSRVEGLQGVIDLSGGPGYGCELKITIPFQERRMAAAG